MLAEKHPKKVTSDSNYNVSEYPFMLNFSQYNIREIEKEAYGCEKD